MTSRRAGALAEMYGAAKYKPVKLFQLLYPLPLPMQVAWAPVARS
jgi:hypothetical protein